MYKNFIKAMKDKKITFTQIAELLHCQLNTVSKGVKVEPNYRDVISVYTRSRKNLSQEEKMRLARIILSDDDDEE